LLTAFFYVSLVFHLMFTTLLNRFILVVVFIFVTSNVKVKLMFATLQVECTICLSRLQ